MFDTFEEGVLFSTVMLSFSNNVIGTGFLLSLTIDEQNKFAIPFLVSNKHLLVKNRNCSLTIKFNKKQEPKSEYKFESYSVDITESLGETLIEHPNSNVDLAIMQLGSYFDKDLINTWFDERLISNFESDEILPFSDIYFVGYPRGQYDQLHNLPIGRKGIIASHPKFDYNGEPHFIIDANVYDGSSGSPVFMELDGRMTIVGIISGTYKYKEPVKNNKDFSSLFDEQITNCIQEVEVAYGLSVVIKSSCLLSFIKEIKEDISQKYKSGNGIFSIKE